MSAPPTAGAGPRLVASDLDGTLLRSDGTASTRTVRVWSALPERGIETVLVTARPPRWVHDLEHLVGPRGVALCGNGAFVYDVASRTLLDAHTFETDLLVGLLGDLRSAVPGVAVAVERLDGLHAEPAFPDRHDDPSRCSAHGDDASLAGAPVGKVLAVSPGQDAEAFLTSVAAVLGDRGHLAYSGALGLAEINPVGVTKAAVLHRWCAELGIAPSGVWAFGDMPNDVPMLAWAGTSFAVANGHPEAIAAASRVCPSNDDDGVAHTLEPLLG